MKKRNPTAPNTWTPVAETTEAVTGVRETEHTATDDVHLPPTLKPGHRAGFRVSRACDHPTTKWCHFYLFVLRHFVCSRPKPPVVYIRDAVPLLSESWLHGLGQEASLAWVPAHLCEVKDEFLLGCNRISILSRFVLAAGH